MPPKQQCQRAVRSQAATTCRATTTSTCHLPATRGVREVALAPPPGDTGSPRPSQGTFLPLGSLGRLPVPALEGEEEEEGHPVPGLGTGTAGEQRAPRPSRGSATAAVFCEPCRCLGTHRSRTEPCQPWGCCCLHPAAVTATCRAPTPPCPRPARPSRGGAGVPPAGKDKTLTYPALPPPPPPPFPRGPKARGQPPHSSVGAPSPRGQGGTGGCPGREREAATAPALAAAWSH